MNPQSQPKTAVATTAPALPSLFDIEHVLQELTEINEDHLPTEEARAAYVADLELVIRASIEKRDRIAWRLFDLGQRAEVKRAVAATHKNKAADLERTAKAYELAIDRLKGYVLGVMRTLPKPKRGPRMLEGESTTFTVKGVPPSVEIFDESLVPDRHKYVMARIPLATWRALLTMLEEASKPDVAVRNAGGLKEAVINCPTVVSIADKTELKEALSKTVKCRKCTDGWTTDGENAGAKRIPCPECEGQGTKPATIPGVRLITDKFRLEVA